MIVTKEHLANLREARSLALQAASIIESVLAMDGTTLVAEAVGGVRWRLIDAAGLVNLMVPENEQKPTGRGFLVLDVFREEG